MVRAVCNDLALIWLSTVNYSNLDCIVSILTHCWSNVTVVLFRSVRKMLKKRHDKSNDIIGGKL